jgi:hypothetical protein
MAFGLFLDGQFDQTEEVLLASPFAQWSFDVDLLV